VATNAHGETRRRVRRIAVVVVHVEPESDRMAARLKWRAGIPKLQTELERDTDDLARGGKLTNVARVLGTGVDVRIVLTGTPRETRLDATIPTGYYVRPAKDVRPDCPVRILSDGRVVPRR
jgi:hypothetical protein